MSASAAAALALGSKALLPSLEGARRWRRRLRRQAAPRFGGAVDGGGGGDIGGGGATLAAAPRSRSSNSSGSSSSGSSSSSSSSGAAASDAGAPSLLETAEGVALSDQVQAEAMLRAFGEDVALHTETALLQEEEGSTFFISDILKLVIAPFVAVLLDPIAGPAMRKSSDMLSGSGAAGPVAGFIAKFIGAIIALILGMIVAISVSQAVGEAVIYHCSWQTVDYVGRFVSSAVVETAVNDLNECAARNSAAQFGRQILRRNSRNFLIVPPSSRRYLFHQAMPMQKDIVVGITSDALSDSLTYGLHHTLTNALSDSLAADLTPPTMHYYYCVYCYYYGNFCDVCFKVSDRQLLHRQWWLGASEPGVVH